MKVKLASLKTRLLALGRLRKKRTTKKAFQVAGKGRRLRILKSRFSLRTKKIAYMAGTSKQ